MIKANTTYPITHITYPDRGSIEVITDAHLEAYTPPIKLQELQHELMGQTRIEEGVYVGDVENWLNHRRHVG